jgi:hypothetical protein
VAAGEEVFAGADAVWADENEAAISKTNAANGKSEEGLIVGMFMSVAPRLGSVGSSRGFLAGKVGGGCGAKQNGGHAILRGALGAGVAADAVSLLAFANPEPPLLAADDVALSIKQGEPNRLVGGGLDKEAAIGLDWRGAVDDGSAVRAERFEANLRGRRR